MKRKIVTMSSMTSFVALGLILLSYGVPFFQKQLWMMGIFSLSGALTNWLAVHMLFERVPGLYGSGVIVLHFEGFKGGIRNLLVKQFFSQENIQRLLEEEGGAMDLRPVVASLDYNRLFENLKKAILNSSLGGMLGMFGGASLLDNFRESFIEGMQAAILEEVGSPAFQEHLEAAAPSREALFKKVDILITKRLDELTPTMVKEIIEEMIRQHLGWLVLWGGVFGALMGLVSTLIPYTP